MKKALIWKKERNGVRCELCARRCFIPKGKKGFCAVRVNKNNTLYTINYGVLCSVNVEPIEKKPFFHFLPGSKTLSIAAMGCNFACKFCCNWEISQGLKEGMELKGKKYSPHQIITLAKKNDCKVIAYTYTEPTVFFEFMLDVAREAKKEGLKNVMVTNGYMSNEAVKKIYKYMDAAVVDVKASLNTSFYKKYMEVSDVEPIFETLKRLKKRRIFIEVTNLIVPELGDDRKGCVRLAEWISTELGSDTPFHVIGFFPSYKMQDVPPTPVETLERLVDEARKAGLRYVYIGNVPGHKYENTYCYNCGETLIERLGFVLKRVNLVGDRCPSCGCKINLVLDKVEG